MEEWGRGERRVLEWWKGRKLACEERGSDLALHAVHMIAERKWLKRDACSVEPTTVRG